MRLLPPLTYHPIIIETELFKKKGNKYKSMSIQTIELIIMGQEQVRRRATKKVLVLCVKSYEIPVGMKIANSGETSARHKSRH